MRLSFFAALGAISVLLVPSGLAQVKQGGHDFAGAKLTAHPTTSWPTNGGNLYNQRYSPLKAIDRTNVAQLKGVWRTRLRGSGTPPQYSGFAAPLVYDGVAYVSTGANDVFALSIDSGEILWQYEAKLDPKWSIVSTPFIEAFWFTDGLNAGRQDQIYSVSLGLKYNIASNISLTTNVIYEARTSNVPLRHYTDVQIGPRLDFAF